MCGIAGLFDIKGSRPYDPAVLDAMTSAIAHRGPDGAGRHLEPGLALGHRRLAIIDLAGGAQPMRTDDGALAVVFNGEIYNFRDLRAELAERGAVFRTRSDTEVLLHGWRIWGEGLLPRLQGMFAFALWDRAAETLVLARDRFGKKPLHYMLSESGTLAFASEIKAFAPLPEMTDELDREAVEDFFAYGYVPDPKTIYRGVRRLPPAHVMVARRGAPLRIFSYWSVLDHLDRLADASPEALLDRLRAAVRSRLVSDVPLGALLSGGVDSSAVVALMAQESPSTVRTFSIAFGDDGDDETPYALEVARRYGAQADVRRVGARELELVDQLPAIFDEPFGDVSAIPTHAVCAQARAGVTVALSGDGGDEALAGYRRYAFHLAGERVRGWAPAAFRKGLLGPLSTVYPRASWLPRPLRARTTLKELSLDSAGAYARMVQALPIEIRSELLTPEFRRSLGGYDADEVVRAPFGVDAPLDPLQRAQYADLKTYLPGDILTKTDRASMANSLELRSPMLDPDFFTMAFALPPGAKLSRARGGKALLKAALEPHLPADLLYRRKTGFSPPVSAWFRGPLRERLLSLADAPLLRESGVVDVEVVRRMARAHASGLADHSKPLWLVWVFAAFLEHAKQARAAPRRLAA
jgi:asparagine synthase (glutamine-hydrolysing)